jgi:hypothetical protein
VPTDASILIARKKLEKGNSLNTQIFEQKAAPFFYLNFIYIGEGGYK